MNLSGILLLNKAPGMTSHTALQSVKRLFGAQKAGHMGSLDPIATGMLPICFGEATKFSQWLLAKDKTYQVTGVLGATTTTGDLTGETLTTTSADHCTEVQLRAVLPQFLGASMQVPPMYSAIKQQGVPLYRLARRGQVVEREPRSIFIHRIDLLQMEAGCFRLEVCCSKGTYIRTLVEDIGAALQVGAYVSQLHRVSISGWETAAMYLPDELLQMTPAERLACLHPMSEAVQSMPRLVVSTDEKEALYQGKCIQHPPGSEGPESALLSIWHEGTAFLGVAERIGEQIRVKRLVQKEQPNDNNTY